MSFELAGKLIEKFDVNQVSDTFRKRDFVIEKTENQGGKEFTDHIKFQLTQDRCNRYPCFEVFKIKVFRDHESVSGF